MVLAKQQRQRFSNYQKLGYDREINNQIKIKLLISYETVKI